ncbi:MAG: M81 family metallopeptidase [Eubacteriales bacterium]|nr:M81 family metallopeptidase [Eubacteriales bacterium]
MKYNIFVGGIHIESSTFTPYRSNEKDFHITKGEELLKRYPWIDKYSDKVNLIPIMHARALPGGIVERGFYEDYLKEFIEILNNKLKENRIDGFYLDIHGAMSLEGSLDAEGDFIKAIRDKIGVSVPLSASMDLHGNVSETLFELATVLTCYRTAPHIDALETRERTLANLIRVLDERKKGKQIIKTMVSVPILLPGEQTSTEVEPGKSLYKAIPEILKKDDLLDISIWVGFPWADQPRSHATVCAYGFDKNSTVASVKELSKKFWGYKDDFNFVGPVATLKDGLKKAMEAKEKPYFLSDTGDNPGAGGDDDTVVVLREILNQGLQSHKKIALVSIRDAETVKALKNNTIGDFVDVNLGGKINPALGGPVKTKMRLINRYNGKMAGESIILEKDNLKLAVTSNRYQFATEEGFKNAGLGEYADYDIVIVKIGYLEPDLSRAARGWTMLLTPGSVNQDLKSLDFKMLKRPLYPFDDGFTPDLEPLIRQE